MEIEKIAENLEDEDDLIIAQIEENRVCLSDLLSFLIEGQRWKIVDECIDYALLESLIEKNNIEVSQEELRDHLTTYRQCKGLISGSEMHQLLEANHMDESDFLELCRHEAAVVKLKEFLFKDKVEHYFAYRQLSLAKIELYKIAVDSENAAKEIIETLRDGGSFFELAYRHSQDLSTRKQCGYMGVLCVQSLEPRVQELLSGSANGSIVGPIKVAKEYQIFFVEHLHPVTFDGSTRSLLMDELLAQHLKDIRDRGGVKVLI